MLLRRRPTRSRSSTGHRASVAIRDPYPKWAELRRQAPVHQGDANADDAARSMNGGLPVFTVLGYDAVAEVLRDGDRFSTDIFNQLMGPPSAG